MAIINSAAINIGVHMFQIWIIKQQSKVYKGKNLENLLILYQPWSHKPTTYGLGFMLSWQFHFSVVQVCVINF